MAAVFYRKGQILIFRRGPGISGAGFWEFPGGKVEAGESLVAALQREILEEIGISIQVEEKLGENVHHYADKKIHLHFYWVPIPEGIFLLTDHDAFQCIQPQNLDPQILSEADRPIVEKIKNDWRMRD
ncbi:MAG: (deoxy)nucleoside triphosphate pyrophosphohydrolase [Pseudobdellovibrionaceae bacterium]